MAMINKKKKLMTTAIAGSMAAAIAVGGGTFAYLQSQTNDVVNNFKTEQVEVEIEETTPNDYDIIPGTEQGKDPKVTITNTLDSFLYLKVTDNTYGLVTYEIAEGWTKLDGYEDVYYKRVNPCAVDTEGNLVAQEFYVLKDNKVSYDKELVNEDMLDENGNLRTDVALTFSAFAIQARPFVDPTDPADPTTAPTEKDAAETAYQESKTIVVSNRAEFVQAIQDVEDGGIIRFANDVDNTGGDIRINNNKKITIDLGGHSLNSKLYVDSADVTIKNGTLHSTGTGIQFAPKAIGDAHLVIAEDAKIVSDVHGAILVADNSGATHSGVLDVYGELQGNIFVHGTIVDTSSDLVINIYGSIDGGDDNGDIGVGLNGYATVNVKSGATITSMTGIEVRAGKLNVEDGTTITGLAIPTSVTPNGSGTTTNGAGIGIAQHNTKLPIDVNIAGGTIKGYSALYESNPQNNDDESLSKININVTGGTFETINDGANVFSIADKEKINYSNYLDN